MTISAAYPDILQNGTTADAAQVMADFYQIQNDVNANAAHNGANSDITSLSGLTTPLTTVQGGTGASSLAGANLVTIAASAPTAGDIATFTGTGKAIQDSGTLLTSLAPLASPALTGTPTAPTASAGTNTTQIATTAFATSAIAPALLKTNNLSDLNNVATALTNLGFSNTAGGQGSITIPAASGNIIIKWGSFTPPGAGAGSQAFTTPFPNNVFAAVATCQNNAAVNVCAVTAITNGAIALQTWAGGNGTVSVPSTWIAIGN